MWRPRFAHPIWLTLNQAYWNIICRLNLLEGFSHYQNPPDPILSFQGSQQCHPTFDMLSPKHIVSNTLPWSSKNYPGQGKPVVSTPGIYFSIHNSNYNGNCHFISMVFYSCSFGRWYNSNSNPMCHHHAIQTRLNSWIYWDDSKHFCFDTASLSRFQKPSSSFLQSSMSAP